MDDREVSHRVCFRAETSPRNPRRRACPASKIGLKLPRGGVIKRQVGRKGFAADAELGHGLAYVVREEEGGGALVGARGGAQPLVMPPRAEVSCDVEVAEAALVRRLSNAQQEVPYVGLLPMQS